MYICGQRNLLNKIDDLINHDRLPRFIIIVANEGFGKKVVSEYIAMKLDAHFVPSACDVDSVRDTIKNSYNIVERSLFMFFDCDDMSISSKNALLKVTEEPPNNAYFVMTVRDISSVLETIKSRGTIFNLDTYNQNDLDDFIKQKNYDFDNDTLSIIHNICVCPKDIIIANSVNIKEIYDLADRFIQYIGQVNIANELKITTQLSTKKDDEKIDPVLFLRCIMVSCNNYILNDCSLDDYKVFNSIIKETSSCLRTICTKGVNKQMALDNWILNTHLSVNGGNL